MDKRETISGERPVQKESGQVPVPAGTESRARWPDTAQRTRGRQAALTRNLHTWSNYKVWAEKVRSTWEPEPKK
jgi:hypothetical protein